ncbi:unnamed protein product [Dibothriocephalus latus]|uniref:Uncharacterized protein n=1 Tax=Dibothriocephalus latus TaxID=60516 RepID=A0A3P6TSU6_DIBLA|nr:unnamed protein product [Dibothriocephalus latus]
MERVIQEAMRSKLPKALSFVSNDSKETDEDIRYNYDLGWANSKTFTKQLAKDNIDVDILNDELIRHAERRRSRSCRQKLLSTFRSSAAQFLLCFLVLLDSCLVIAEIILEIRSIQTCDLDLLSKCFVVRKTSLTEEEFNERLTDPSTLHFASEVMHFISIGVTSLFIICIVLKLVCLRRKFFTNVYEKQILALEELSRSLGSPEENIRDCKPRYVRHSKEQTQNALKSIAALTTGFMGGMIGAPISRQEALARFTGNNIAGSPSQHNPQLFKRFETFAI